jgi:hypothetical protein
MESKRDKYLYAKYGIGEREYQEMFLSQGGVCAVCNRPPKPGKNMNVDHDHKTGEVRGLLCYYCNRRLVGNNRPESVIKLVNYLMPEWMLVPKDFRHTKLCSCLVCIRREVNSGNKFMKEKK